MACFLAVAHSLCSDYQSFLLNISYWGGEDAFWLNFSAFYCLVQLDCAISCLQKKYLFQLKFIGK